MPAEVLDTEESLLFSPAYPVFGNTVMIILSVGSQAKANLSWILTAGKTHGTFRFMAAKPLYPRHQQCNTNHIQDH